MVSLWNEKLLRICKLFEYVVHSYHVVSIKTATKIELYQTTMIYMSNDELNIM